MYHHKIFEGELLDEFLSKCLLQIFSDKWFYQRQFTRLDGTNQATTGIKGLMFVSNELC